MKLSHLATQPDLKNCYETGREMVFRELVNGAAHAWSRGGLAVDSIKSIVIKGSFLAIQVATSVLLARALGPAGYGDYSLAITVVSLLVVLAETGFPSYLVRMVAAYRADGELGLVAKLVKSSLLMVLAASLLTGLLVFVVLNDWLEKFLPLPEELAVLALFLVPVMALLHTSVGAMRGMGFVIGGELFSQILRPSLFLICVVSIYVYQANVSVSPNLMLGLNLAATGTTAVVSLLALFRRVPRTKNVVTVPGATPLAWLGGSLPFLLLASAQLINQQIDTLMIGILGDQEQVGLYRVAVQLSDGAQMVLMAISVVVGPRLAYLHARGEWDKIERVLVQSHQFGFLLVLPIAGVFALGMGEPLITIVFGPEYAPSVGSAIVLLGGKVAYALVGYCGLALSMFGYAYVATWTVGLIIVVNCILNAVLIPSYGIEGAAFSTVVSQFALNALLAIWMKGKFGRNFTPLRKITTRKRGNGSRV